MGDVKSFCIFLPFSKQSNCGNLIVFCVVGYYFAIYYLVDVVSVMKCVCVFFFSFWSCDIFAFCSCGILYGWYYILVIILLRLWVLRKLCVFAFCKGCRCGKCALRTCLLFVGSYFIDVVKTVCVFLRFFKGCCCTHSFAFFWGGVIILLTLWML